MNVENLGSGIQKTYPMMFGCSSKVCFGMWMELSLFKRSVHFHSELHCLLWNLAYRNLSIWRSHRDIHCSHTWIQKIGILQSLRNNLRQLPDLNFFRILAGILRGWDLTIERNEELQLWQSIRALFLSVSATIFCENFVTDVDMHGRFSRWRKWRSCDVEEEKEGLENEL